MSVNGKRANKIVLRLLVANVMNFSGLEFVASMGTFRGAFAKTVQRSTDETIRTGYF